MDHNNHTAYIPMTTECTSTCPQSRRVGFSVWLNHGELCRLKQSPRSLPSLLLYLGTASLCSANTNVSWNSRWTRTSKWFGIIFFFTAWKKKCLYLAEKNVYQWKFFVLNCTFIFITALCSGRGQLPAHCSSFLLGHCLPKSEEPKKTYSSICSTAAHFTAIQLP